MNDETEAYHLADIEESRDDYDSINYSYQYKRCRVKEPVKDGSAILELRIQTG